MPRLPLALALAALLLPLTAAAQPARKAVAEKPKYRSAKEIVDAAPAGDWRVPAADNLLLMRFGDGREALIELAPQFAPRHVANIRALANGGFWNGTSIYRSQDNFVVQFGDAEADDAAKAKPIPQGVADKIPAEFERSDKGLAFTAMPDHDGWAAQAGFVQGFPAARDPKTGKAWLAHCYGTLGAGRGNAPDSSIGAELYVVTGQSPRGLDRNITVVGRVLQGMEFLSVIPRGPEPMGFYSNPALRTPIQSIVLASRLPQADRPRIEVLRTDSRTFRDMVEARRNRRDAWYLHPAGHIDLCNINIPVRARKP